MASSIVVYPIPTFSPLQADPLYTLPPVFEVDTSNHPPLHQADSGPKSPYGSDQDVRSPLHSPHSPQSPNKTTRFSFPVGSHESLSGGSLSGSLNGSLNGSLSGSLNGSLSQGRQRSRPRRKRSRPSTSAKREKRETKRTVYLSPLPRDSTDETVRELLKPFGELQLVEFEGNSVDPATADPATGGQGETPLSCFARFESTPQAVNAIKAGESSGIKIIYKSDHLECQKPLTPKKKTSNRQQNHVEEPRNWQQNRRKKENQTRLSGRRSISVAELDKSNWRGTMANHRRHKSSGSGVPNDPSVPLVPSRHYQNRPRSHSDGSALVSSRGDDPRFAKNTNGDDPRFAKNTNGRGGFTACRPRLSINPRRASKDSQLAQGDCKVAKGPDGSAGFNWKYNPRWNQCQEMSGEDNKTSAAEVA